MALSTINTSLPQADRSSYTANILLSCLSKPTLRAICSMGLSDIELDDPDIIIGKLCERCNAGRNCHVWRHQFAHRTQREKESIHHPSNRLKPSHLILIPKQRLVHLSRLVNAIPGVHQPVPLQTDAGTVELSRSTNVPNAQLMGQSVVAVERLAISRKYALKTHLNQRRRAVSSLAPS